MAPKRKAPHPRTRIPNDEIPNDETPTMSQLIAEQIAAAIPVIVAQLKASMDQDGNGPSGSGPSGGGSGSERLILTNPPRGCTFKDFMNCKPLEFKGTEGAVGIMRWMEKAESVFAISKCAEDCKVNYTTCTFQGKALTWWNSEIRTRGREQIDAMTWVELKKILTAQYCPKNELKKLEAEFWELSMRGSNLQEYTNRFHDLSQLVPHLVNIEERRVDRYLYGLSQEIRGNVTASKPATLQEAITFAGTMNDDAERGGKMKKYENRNDTGNKRARDDYHNNAGKRFDSRKDANPRPIRSYAAVEGRQYVGPHPKCDKCGYHHTGACRFCEKCKKYGHTEQSCRMGGISPPACFECGSPDHFRNKCPKLIKNVASTSKQALIIPTTSKPRCYIMGNPKANEEANLPNYD